MASQEDCKYCAQSTRHKTKVKATPMMQKDEVLEAARRAKMAGSTRFCMGTAWREMGKKDKMFRNILSMVEQVNGLGLEVCCTLGMVNQHQAKQLKAAVRRPVIGKSEFGGRRMAASR